MVPFGCFVWMILWITGNYAFFFLFSFFFLSFFLPTILLRDHVAHLFSLSVTVIVIAFEGEYRFPESLTVHVVRFVYMYLPPCMYLLYYDDTAWVIAG